jgi:NitT/TauT family transport system substrate-binding protein
MATSFEWCHSPAVLFGAEWLTAARLPGRLLWGVSGCLFLFAGAVDAQPLRIGHFPNITHAQAVYARATGELEKALGVPVEWVSFNAGPSAIEALFTDAVDVTFVGPNPAINGYLKSKGSKYVIIAGAASGGAALIIRPDSGIQTDRDFDHKAIATPQLGNTQDVAARIWFAQNGYRLTEKGGTLALIPLSNPDQLTMFRKKQIDGAWTVEPWVSRLELEAQGKVFLEEKSLWPEGRFVTTQLVANKNVLVARRDVLKKLLAAYVEITQKINVDKTSAANILNAELKKETTKALKQEVIEKAMSRVEFTWDPISTSLHASAEAAHKIGFLRKAPVLDGIYDVSLLNEVLKEKNLPEVSAK